MPKLIRVIALGPLLVAGALAQVGCQACGSCHDYDSPVSGCTCGGCGGRSGSAVAGSAMMGGYASNEAAPSKRTVVAGGRPTSPAEVASAPTLTR